MSVQLTRFTLDSNARRSANGTALFGGSPFRLLRLTRRGSKLLDGWLAGGPPPTSASERALLDKLVDAGVLHPVIEETSGSNRDVGVGFVIPVFDDPVGAARAVASIRFDFPDAAIVVVDDASSSPVSGLDATLVRLDINAGPGAARNRGEAELPDDVEVVVFVDSDVVVAPDAIGRLLAHFDAPTVVAAGPRIRAVPGGRVIDRYEATASPLDMGEHPSVVRPGSPVPYLPSTVLAVRRAAFAAIEGFHEPMRVGEDVDLVWRLVDAGGVVRYEPAAEAHHRVRPDWAALARQRLAYGTAAATLEARHPGNVRPVELPAPMLAAWASAALGGMPGAAVGLAVSAVEARRLYDRLPESMPDRAAQTRALSLLGHRHAARWLAHALRRAWLPLFVVGGLVSRRLRRVALAGVVGGSAADFLRERPTVDPLTHLAATVVDDTSYCRGLWRGMCRARSFVALRPRTRPRA